MASGGYDFKFTTDVPDRLVCKICQLASRDPHLSVCCGHIFCKTCIEKTKKSQHPACPMCRDKEFSNVLNKQIDREVKSLSVHCTNNGEGCTWTGDLRELLVHAATCGFEMVLCDYHNIGCMEKVCRKDMKTHNKESAEEHLALSVMKLRNLEQFVYQLSVSGMIQGKVKGNSVGGNWSMQLSRLSIMTATSGDQVCPVIVKVPEYTRKKVDNKLWYSNSFYSHDKGYKMCWKIYPAGAGAGRGTHISVSLCLMKGPHDDELTWPLRGKFEFKLLNQISDCDHHISKALNYGGEHISNSAAERVTDGDRAATGWGFQQFYSHEDLDKVTPKCQYLKDDCIFLQVNKVYP